MSNKRLGFLFRCKAIPTFMIFIALCLTFILLMGNWFWASGAKNFNLPDFELKLHENGVLPYSIPANIPGRIWPIPQTYTGQFTIYYSNEVLAVKGTKSSRGLEGPCVSWYKNGALCYYEEYRHGLKHGRTIGWFKNGTKGIESTYLNGKTHGKMKSWYADGRFKQLRFFEHGELASAGPPPENSKPKGGTPAASGAREAQAEE